MLHIARSWLLALVLSGLFACAAAPPGPSDDPLAEQNEADAADAGDAPSSDDDVEEEVPLDASAAPVIDARPHDAAEPARDTAAPHVDDAAAQRDAGPNPPSGEGHRDAAAAPPTDAAVADAAPPVRDAAAARDAATAPPQDGRCQRSSDCDQFCAFVGIFPCCGSNRRCGCTWAPGAYCL